MKILGLNSEVVFNDESGVVNSISREWIKVKTADASFVMFFNDVLSALDTGKLVVTKI